MTERGTVTGMMEGEDEQRPALKIHVRYWNRNYNVI